MPHIPETRRFRGCTPVSYTHLDVYKRQGLEPLAGLAVPEDNGADLGDALVPAGKARRLQVEGDEVPPQRQVPHTVDDDAVVHVIDIISLAAVENLHRLVRPVDRAATLDLSLIHI